MFSKLQISLLLFLVLCTSVSFGQSGIDDISAVIDDVRAASSKAQKEVAIQKLLDTLACDSEKQKNLDFLDSEYQFAKRNKWTDLQKKIGIKYMNISYCNFKYQASIKYCEEIKKLALEEKDTISWLAAHRREGAYHVREKEYEKAKEKFEIGYKWSKQIGSKRYMAFFLEEIGNVNYYLEGLDSYVKYFQKAGQLYSRETDLVELAHNKRALGLCYYNGYNPDSSFIYYQASLDALDSIIHPTPQNLRLKGDILKSFTGRPLYHILSRDSIISNYLASFDLLQNGRNNFDKSNCTYYIGDEYYIMGNFTEALKYYKMSLDFTKEIEYNEYNISWSEAVIGNMYYHMGEYKKALPLLHNFIEQSKERRRFYNQLEYQIILAEVYLTLNDYEMATNLVDDLLLKYQKISDHTTGEISYISIVRLTKGKIYIAQEQYDKAEVFLQIALDSIISRKEEFSYSAIYAAFGELKSKQDLHEEALVYFKKSLNEAKQRGQKLEIAEAFYKIGFTEQQLLQYSNAIKTYLTGLEYAEDVTHTTIFMDIYKGLSESYAQIGDYRKAYEYQVKYKQAEDELLLEQQKREISELESDFLLKEKETENKLLKNEQTMNENTIRQRNIVLISLLIIVALISFIAFTLRKVNQKEKQQNELLEEQVQARTEELQVSNKSLEQANDNLEQANYELRTFNYIASHDIKEPIRNIGSYASLIHRKLPDDLKESLGDYFKTIKRNTSQLYTLIEDFARYTSLSKNESVDQQKVDLNELVDAVEAGLEMAIQKYNGTVINHGLPTIYSNNSLLYTIFKNLIENGLKYNQSKTPTVEVSYQRTPTHHQISFKDNGIGIAPEYHGRIFEMFKRLHNRAEYEGSGIGLAIVKLSVNKLEGEIQIDSVEGEGSKFIICLPL